MTPLVTDGVADCRVTNCAYY